MKYINKNGPKLLLEQRVSFSAVVVSSSINHLEFDMEGLGFVESSAVW
jgi:hypothetical protein